MAIAPTTVQNTIPSYLYWQYNDDVNLQAFVAAYNTMAQQYVNSFNQLNLPVYAGNPVLTGPLLDWVLNGLYGIARPILPSGTSQLIGTYNSAPYDSIAYNKIKTTGSANLFVTTDDIYKRIATWNLYKGDGQVFSVVWLKRRIMRFLTGANGADPGVNQTYQISVSFGTNNQVNIRIVKGTRKILGGAYGSAPYDTIAYDSVKSTFTAFPSYSMAPVLQSAIKYGAVNLPFQYTYVVTD